MLLMGSDAVLSHGSEVQKYIRNISSGIWSESLFSDSFLFHLQSFEIQEEKIEYGLQCSSLPFSLTI